MAALNSAVVLAKVEGSRAGLDAIARLPRTAALADYPLYQSVEVQLQLEAGMEDAARASFRKALGLAGNEAERGFLRRRPEVLEARRWKQRLRV